MRLSPYVHSRPSFKPLILMLPLISMLAHIRCYKSAGTDHGVQIEYLSMKLEQAYIRDYHIYTSARLARPCEVFELSAQQITMTCAPQTETGSRGADVTFTLDVSARRVT